MAQLTEIQNTQRQLEDTFSKRMAELEEQLQSGGTAKDTVARVAEEFRTFREIVFNMFRLLRQQIQECARTIDVIETRHRQKSLLFLGVSEVEKEDCTTTILGIANKTMALNDISPAAISVCHRIGTPNKDRPRPVLIKFSTSSHRSAVWRAKSKLKGSPISVKEFLTKSRQLVFGKARQHFGMRSCWSQDGVIIVKTPDGVRHKISTIDELHTLTAKFPMSSDNSSAASRSGAQNTGTSKSRRN